MKRAVARDACGATAHLVAAAVPPAVGRARAGRPEVQRWLDGAAADPTAAPPVLSLVGPPGAGTTSAAAAEAHRAGQRGWAVLWVRGASEGCLYADLGVAAAVLSQRSGDAGEARRTHAGGPTGLPAALAADGRRWLVVVDDLRVPDLLTRYLPRAAGVAVLVTTSSQRARRLGPVLHVHGPSDRDAVELVAGHLHRRAARRLARSALAAVGGSALGLRLAVGAVVAGGRGRTDRAVDAAGPLARLVDAGRPLVAAVGWAWQAAVADDPDTGRLLAALAALGPVVVPRTATTLLDPDGARLDRLVACGLVAADEDRLSVPDPVQCVVLGELVRDPVAAGEDAAGLLVAALGYGRVRPTAVGGEPSPDAGGGLVADEAGTGGPAAGSAGADGDGPLDLLAWLPSLQSLARTVGGTARPCPTAAELVDVALERLAPTVPPRLLLDLYEARAALTEVALSRRDMAAWRARRDLAVARVNGGRAPLAVGDFERLVGEVEPAVGAGHPEALLTRCGLGVALLEANRVEAAASELTPLVPALEAACGPADATTRRAAQYLAATRLRQGRTAEAVAAFERLVTASVRACGPAHADTITLRRDLAGAYLAADRPADALAELDRAQGARATGGPGARGRDRRAVLAARRVRAVALARLDRAEEATVLLQTTARELDAVCGVGSSEALGAWCELVGAYDRAGRPADAVALAEQVVPEARRCLGAGHPVTLAAAQRLAAARLDRQDPEGAVEVLADVMAAAARAGLPAGALGEAARLLARAEQGLESTTARRPDAPGAPALDAPTGARSVASDAPTLAVGPPARPVRTGSGTVSPAVLLGRADALLGAGRLEAAAVEYRAALAVSPAPDEARYARRQLAAVHRAAGRPEQLVDVLLDDAAASAAHLGPDHPVTLRSRHRHAAVLLDGALHEQAAAALAALVDDCARALGADHPLTVAARINYASARHRAGPSIDDPGDDGVDLAARPVPGSRVPREMTDWGACVNGRWEAPFSRAPTACSS